MYALSSIPGGGILDHNMVYKGSMLQSPIWVLRCFKDILVKGNMYL